jgi:post-segregation antitoxin (ccd killing protein)
VFILGVEVVVPRRLVEEAERRGLDINDLVVEAMGC